VIADPEGSVGSYISSARKSDLLVEVWLVAHGVLCSHETPIILNILCLNKCIRTLIPISTWTLATALRGNNLKRTKRSYDTLCAFDYYKRGSWSFCPVSGAIKQEIINQVETHCYKSLTDRLGREV
jgi:hypothetical protein